MPDIHEVTEPVDYAAYHHARSRVLGLLSMWIFDERQKLYDDHGGIVNRERWMALADVSAELHRLENAEMSPAAREAQGTNADPTRPDGEIK